MKLINALPFVCGDLRTDTLGRVWANFQEAWKNPKVSEFIEAMDRDPNMTKTLHQWVDV